MICFFPVVKLRELGKRIEMRDLEELCEEMGYDSVERTIAGVMYRFFCDTRCPALFIKVPREGDEVIKGLVWLTDCSFDKINDIVLSCAEACAANYGYDTGFDVMKEGRVSLVVKRNFMKGEWESYGFDYAGKNGVSIPA